MHHMCAGILALRSGAATRAFVRRLLRFYDGDAAHIARECLCAAHSMRHDAALPCRSSWFHENLYMDDLFVWSLYLHWDLRSSQTLSHGHFGTHRNVTPGAKGAADRAWMLDSAGGGGDGGGGGGGGGGFSRVGSGGEMLCRWRRSWKTICPAATADASPFDVLDKFHHVISGTGAYSTMARPRAHGGDNHSVAPPKSVLDSASHGWKARLLVRAVSSPRKAATQRSPPPMPYPSTRHLLLLPFDRAWTR